MKRPLLALAALVAVSGVAWGKTDPKPKKPQVLRVAHTYADAMAEAKERSCVVFATFHEDGWHFCVDQHRSVFDNAEFIAWANENVVFLVGHKGTSHADFKKGGDAKKDDPKKGEDGKAGPKSEGDSGGADASSSDGDKPKTKGSADGCSIYAGITCDEHEKIMDDAKEGKGGPKLEVQGFPTSYMIAPDGTFTRHEHDRTVKELEDGVNDYAKKKSLHPSKKFLGYLQALDEGDKAVEAGKWRDAIAAYQKVDAVGKKMTGLAASLAPRITALDEAVKDAFAKLRDDAAKDAAAKYATVKTLRSDVGGKFAAGPLPVVADLDEWLKSNAPPPKAPGK